MGKHKRKNEEDINKIYKKLKKLQKKVKKRKTKKSRSRSSTPNISDKEIELNIASPELEVIPPINLEENLDPEMINILGEDPAENKKYGDPIHKDISCRWSHIVNEGLSKDNKEDFKKSYMLPENCQFFESPTLNPEIQAAISDSVQKRDRVLAGQQDQLGLAIGGLGKALNMVLKENNKPVSKILSDTGRTLCNLFHNKSKSRRSLIQFALNKETKDIVANTKCTKYLFGDNLGEALRAGKAIHKAGAEIAQKPKKPLNYRGPPPRFQQPGMSAGNVVQQKAPTQGFKPRQQQRQMQQQRQTQRQPHRQQQSYKAQRK